jgi:predicted nucleic acid-binding Zn finger protein
MRRVAFLHPFTISFQIWLYISNLNSHVLLRIYCFCIFFLFCIIRESSLAQVCGGEAEQLHVVVILSSEAITGFSLCHPSLKVTFLIYRAANRKLFN